MASFAIAAATPSTATELAPTGPKSMEEFASLERTCVRKHSRLAKESDKDWARRKGVKGALCWYVATSYLYGDEFVKEPKPDRAISLAVRSCELGWAMGCTLAGVALVENPNPDSGQRRALDYFEAACSHEFPDKDGCFNAGVALSDSPQRAIPYFSRACDLGQPDGCHNLANEIKNGELGTPNMRKVAELRARACELGRASACHDLALELSKGETHMKEGPERTAKALELLEKACLADIARACLLAGVLFKDLSDQLKSIGSENTAVQGLAQNFLRRGCRLGEQEACKELKRNELGQ